LAIPTFACVQNWRASLLRGTKRKKLRKRNRKETAENDKSDYRIKADKRKAAVEGSVIVICDKNDTRS